MNKIILLACSILLCAGPTKAQHVPDIKFENGQLILDEANSCCMGASKQKVKSNSATTTSKVGTPTSQVYNDKAAMLNVSKDGEDWFLEVPDSIVGRLILAVTRFTSTPAGLGIYGGEQMSRATVYFEKTPTNDALLLRNKKLFIFADTLDVISKAVKSSSSDPIIGNFKIEGTRDHKYKIKISSLLLNNSAFSLSPSMKAALKISNLNQELSYVESVHSYPINTEIRVVTTFNIMAGNNSTITFGLNTSFLLLPKEPMQPRFFDPRVGYFTGGYYLYSDNQQQVERSTFITRRRLEPKSPEDAQRQLNGELIEPKQQIVYYIDPATPKQWRPYLIQGVKDWNSAFEQAGWKNAITALEWPENDSTMSIEDARYSVIMYLASDIANAYGPQNHDPRSGEILESNVGWYHNVMTLVHDWYQVQCGATDPEARKAKYSEELMGELIRFVSSHEIGHTLGLRHNFGSSSTVPVDSLRSNTYLAKWGHCPSIMDYARFDYVAQPEDNIERANLFPRINDYDKWAIEWGYKPEYETTDAESERYVLIQKTSDRLNANRRLWWGDGEGFNSDPRCQTEDLGDNAVKASELGIANLKRILPHLSEWNYWGSDTENENLNNMYNAVATQYLRYCLHVIRNLTGVNRNVLSQDQQGKVFEYPSRETAARVIPFVEKYIIDEPTWLVDVPYADRLYGNRDIALQKITRNLILNITLGGVIANVNPLYGSADYLKDLTKAIFKNGDTSKKLTQYQRFVQQIFVDNLCASYTASKSGVGSDALACILSTLKSLDKKFRNVSNSDIMTQAHYAQLSDQIQRALYIK